MKKFRGIVYRVSLGELGRMRFFNSAVDGIIGYSATELSKGEICSIDRLVVKETKPEW